MLFATNIFSNICFGTPGASEKEVRAAALAANAAAFIERLPEGYHTQVRCHASACRSPVVVRDINQGKEGGTHVLDST